MTPKICVYTICKDEASNVLPWLQNVAEADLVVVVDTGSTDTTWEQLEAAASGSPLVIAQLLLTTFDFAVARNVALARAQQEIPKLERSNWLLISIDLDERLPDNWYSVLCDLNPMVGALRYTEGAISWYATKVVGAACISHWQYTVHEVWRVKAEEEPMLLPLIVTHQPDPAKPRDYLPLLKQQAETLTPPDSRAWYYYARELAAVAPATAAAQAYTTALACSTWSFERADICCCLGQLTAPAAPAAAAAWYWRALVEEPSYRRSYALLAQAAWKQQDWIQTIYFLREMLGTDPAAAIGFFVNQDHYGPIPHSMLGWAYYQLGQLVAALDATRAAIGRANVEDRDYYVRNHQELLALCLSRGPGLGGGYQLLPTVTVAT